jgi:hypothetical protein
MYQINPVQILALYFSTTGQVLSIFFKGFETKKSGQKFINIGNEEADGLLYYASHLSQERALNKRVV